MKLLLTLLAIVGLTLVLLAFADGPSLLEIIDNPKF